MTLIQRVGLSTRTFAAIVLSCALASSTLGTDAVEASNEPGGAVETPLSIASDPAGAVIYLDGAFVGHTPLSLATTRGDHRVRVTKPGYLENSRIVTVGVGRTAAVRIQLTARPPQAAQNAGLKIVVIEGEDAVNVLQQRTAVAPVVEVRDRNDQPVAGAIVNFSIRGGRATFSGARTLAVTTNTAGRAAATGFTPTGTGTVQIAASASFQGQTAAVAIAQTNVATAAQAAAATSGSAAGGGAAAGGTAAAGGSAAAGAAAAGAVAGGAAGGGLSLATIGIIGAAAVGGTVAATQVGGGSSSGNQSATRTFAGPVSWTLTTNYSDKTTGKFSCAESETVTATLTLTMDQSGGALTGTGNANLAGSFLVVADSCSDGHPVGSSSSGTLGPLAVTGTPASLSISEQRTDTGPATGNPGLIVTTTTTITFSGSFSGNAISGSLTVANREDGPFQIGTGSVTVQISLQ